MCYEDISDVLPADLESVDMDSVDMESISESSFSQSPVVLCLDTLGDLVHDELMLL
jgi:hypothetical protein